MSDDPLPSDGKSFSERRIVFGGIALLVFGIFFILGARNVFAEDNNLGKDININIESIDPLSRIGIGLLQKKCDNPNSLCGGLEKAEKLGMGNEKIAKMVAGYPILEMVPYISQRDSRVAHFLVAIAKKESDWGRHTPKKNGKECYNFWGYRGPENTTESGYSCFDSPAHAIEVVGNRIEKLVNSHVDTPERMVVWKCGSNCEAAGGQAAANKWIADVRALFVKLNS